MTDIPTDIPVLGEATIEEFRVSLRGSLIRPGDSDYDAARTVWNGMIDKHPALIVRCSGVSDVMRAVQFARSHNLPVAVRGGGHNVTGAAVCDGGLVIDFSEMKSVRVDPVHRSARAEPGATWSDFDHETQAHGLATTGGLVSSTGVAGFTLGGGIGWLVRKHGLACDNLLSVDIVTADGRLLTASPEENSDLFWGVRGGGGNFGIITSFEFRLYPLSHVVGGLVAHPIERAGEVLRFYRDFVENAPDELTTLVVFVTMPDGFRVVGIGACYAGPLEQGEEVIGPLRRFGPPVADMFGPVPYTALQAANDPSAPAGMQNYWKASFLAGLSDEAIDTIVEHAMGMTSPLSAVHVHHLGGAMSRVAPDATAYNQRDSEFVVNIIGMWASPAEHDSHVDWVRHLYSALQPYSTGGAYLNFLGDEGQERVRAAYGGNYDRLLALKYKYDPTNFFRLNQNIRPTG
jgi:FAD/FMN-containing dehydrogenase